MLSRRTTHDARQNPLTLAFEHARSEGRMVLDLTTSNPTRAGIPYDEASILASLATRRALVYEPEPFGLLSARGGGRSRLARAWARGVLRFRPTG